MESTIPTSAATLGVARVLLRRLPLDWDALLKAVWIRSALTPDEREGIERGALAVHGSAEPRSYLVDLSDWVWFADGRLFAAGLRPGGRLCAALETAPEDDDAKAALRAVRNELRSIIKEVRLSPVKPRLTRSAARVWEYVKDRPSMPTYDDMTSDLRIGRGTVSKALRELRARGLLPPGGTEIVPK